jgi:hypothetical protein
MGFIGTEALQRICSAGFGPHRREWRVTVFVCHISASLIMDFQGDILVSEIEGFNADTGP